MTSGWEKRTSYIFTADGIRTSKTVGGVKHKYTLDGSRIVSEVWTKNGVEYFLYFIYDENGSPAGIEYRTSEYEDGEFDYYFFDKNIFGDIIGIYNENGRKICTYTYNAWGECTVSVASGLNGTEFLMAHEYNPFRYRWYYYDIETRYYYLQTRYYNPEWGRFLNADGYVNANGDILGYNMFAYCSNNPISFNDPTGEGKVWDWLKEKVVDPAGKIIVKSVFSVVNMIDPNISTIETGISISMSEGVHISASANIAIDKSGNIGVNYSLGGGGCTSSGASVTRTFSVSSAETIYDLAGWGVDVGGSVMIPIPETPVSVGGGYDFSVGKRRHIYYFDIFSRGWSRISSC